VRGVAVILDGRDERPGQKFKNSGPVGFNSIPVTVQFWDRRGFFPNTLGRRLVLAERDCVADQPQQWMVAAKLLPENWRGGKYAMRFWSGATLVILTVRRQICLSESGDFVISRLELRAHERKSKQRIAAGLAGGHD
jgi:hypothetical protein